MLNLHLCGGMQIFVKTSTGQLALRSSCPTPSIVSRSRYRHPPTSYLRHKQLEDSCTQLAVATSPCFLIYSSYFLCTHFNDDLHLFFSTCVNLRACDAFPATRHKPWSFSCLFQANRACARKGTGLEKAPGLDSFSFLSCLKKLEKCKKDSV